MSDGTVFGYAADMEMGVIITHDEKRYIFVKADWPFPEIMPKDGVIVTFEAPGTLAKKIRIIDRSSLS